MIGFKKACDITQHEIGGHGVKLVHAIEMHGEGIPRHEALQVESPGELTAFVGQQTRWSTRTY